MSEKVNGEKKKQGFNVYLDDKDGTLTKNGYRLKWAYICGNKKIKEHWSLKHETSKWKDEDEIKQIVQNVLNVKIENLQEQLHHVLKFTYEDDEVHMFNTTTYFSLSNVDQSKYNVAMQIQKGIIPDGIKIRNYAIHPSLKIIDFPISYTDDEDQDKEDQNKGEENDYQDQESQ